MKAKKIFREVKPEYCCLDLVRAVDSELLDEVVSGIRFPVGGCEAILLNYCPFCRAKIITKKTDTGWDWEAIKPREEDK